MNHKRKVVVTGLGIATSLGLDVEENWQKVLSGVSGIRRISIPGAGKSPVQSVGAVTGTDWSTIRATFPGEAESEGERRTLFALWSAQSAMNDAGLSASEGDRGRYGVVLAAGLGINRPEDIQEWMTDGKTFDFAGFSREYHDVHRESIIRNNSNRAAALIARKFSLNGYNATVTTACASASQAIGIAFRTIRRGDADLMLAGGADSMINPVGLVFFVLLSAAAAETGDPAGICRPFDRKRSGLVMGEGAGIAVLEEESHARLRGATVYAEVAGYGTSMDAYRVTAPHPKAEGAVAAITDALADANTTIHDIDYINAHGTGTKLNDTAETAAIKTVFGERARQLAISSSKSMIGHLIAASGGPEFIYTALTVNRDEIHPTINLNNPDPRCDLDYVPNEKRSTRVRAAISNSFGFGGQNASLVVKKYVTA